jgi:pimeloyl-ACP methyl ester carboxylesterase
MSSRQWRRLTDRLSPRFAVTAWDFLGCGDNPPWPPGVPFSFEQDLDALKMGEPFHLVGHSYGGFIGLLLARARPQDILSISLYDPTSFGVLHDDPEGQGDLARILENPVMFDDAQGGQEPWLQAFVDYWSGPGAWEALPDATRQSFRRVGRKLYYEATTLSREPSPAESYRHITAPSLLMHGEHSPVSVRRVIQRLGQVLPRATVQPIAGAGHMGPITHADVVNELIDGLVSATPGS